MVVDTSQVDLVVDSGTSTGSIIYIHKHYANILSVLPMEYVLTTN